MPDRRFALLAVAGAALFLLAFRASAVWGDDFVPSYGSFPLSRGELSFRLSQLLYVLPAALLLALAAGAVATERAVRVFDALDRAPARAAWALAALATLAAGAVRVLVLRGVEVTDDENAYRFQAWILEHGALTASSVAAELRPFFDNQFIINDGRWYASYFIGHPALLALARQLSVEEALGPLCAGACTLLTFAIGRLAFGPRVGIVGAALVALSPFTAFLFATRLSQTTSAVALGVVALAALRVDEQPARIRSWAALGLATSCAMFIRPQTALPFAAALFAPLAWRLVRRALRPPAWGPLVAVAGLALGAAGMLAVNWAQNGGALITGYQVLARTAPHPVFPTGVVPSLMQLTDSGAHLMFWLFGWPVSLAFVPFFERRPAAVRLAAVCGVVVAFYALTAVPTVAPVGPAYYAELLPALALLTASGWQRGVQALVGLARPRGAAALIASPAVLALLALVTFVPAHAWWLSRSADVTALPYRAADAAGLSHALVFVDELPNRTLPPHSWAYYRRNPAPDLSDPVVWANDLGDERNRELVRALGRAGFRLALVDGAVRFVPLPP